MSLEVMEDIVTEHRGGPDDNKHAMQLAWRQASVVGLHFHPGALNNPF
jgi:hypothetical protein